jgi:large subunit ribosomal protein L3
MVTTILGIKKNMSVRFDQFGRRLPVTVIQAEPNVVVNKGADRMKLGLGQKKKAKKPQNSFVNAIGFAPKFVKEAKLESTDQSVNVADKVTVSIFEPQDEVKVTGTTRGKGFTGVIKRWGFHGGPKTHGQSDRHRAPGSIGQTTTPGRVFKGKKMAGHQGNVQKTVIGLEVIEVDSTKNLLVVKGSVPGAKNGFLIIKKTGKVKGYTPPPSPKDEEEPEEKPATDKSTEKAVSTV